MRISYNWIKELIPDLAVSSEELADILTLHSFETVVIGPYAIPAGIKTVQIIKIEKHPNADRLRLATVTDGDQEFTVVCGAPNIEVGQIVPYSPPGAQLKDDEGQAFTVREATIRGVASPGMLNSLRELGLHHDHGGIWVLPPDTPLGKELAELIPPDVILEADITPNRAHDCLSHLGIAHEVAALQNLAVREPQLPDLPASQEDVAGFTVTIAEARLCPRYLGVVLESLTVAPSPLWLQARLLAAGGKPINNLVDTTNYVTFEYGNPTHLFDGDALAGKDIGIRRAKPDETLITLDGIQRELNSKDIVITAADKPAAVAGVMGGGGDAVSNDTEHAFLEVANFNAFRVQETSRRLNIRTESSARFSKDLDPNLVSQAAARTLVLLKELAGATIVGILDVYPNPAPARTITFDPSRVSRVAGLDIPAEKSEKILEHFRFKVDDSYQVTVPTDRRDIEGEHDLIEEVIRVIGLEKIPSASPKLLTTHYSLPTNIHWREIVRDTLVELGLSETYNYSFGEENQTYAAREGVATIELKNGPPLRFSLLPGLLKNLDKNREAFHREPQGLFEIGHVYRPGANGKVPGVIEETHLAVAIAGRQPSLESIVEALKQALSLDTLTLPPAPEWAVAPKYRLPQAFFEINLDELLSHVEKEVPPARTLEEIKAQEGAPTKYIPLPKYPSVFRDISLLVEETVSVETAQEIIERIGEKLVADVDLFDEFQPAGQTQKGLAFHVEYRSLDKTLTDAEVNEVHARILATLESEIKAQIR